MLIVPLTQQTKEGMRFFMEFLMPLGDSEGEQAACYIRCG